MQALEAELQQMRQLIEQQRTEITKQRAEITRLQQKQQERSQTPRPTPPSNPSLNTTAPPHKRKAEDHTDNSSDISPRFEKLEHMITELANQMLQQHQENGAHLQQISARLDALETRTTNLESRVAATEAKVLRWESRFTSTASGSLKGVASKPYDRPPLSEISKPIAEPSPPQNGSHS